MRFSMRMLLCVSLLASLLIGTAPLSILGRQVAPDERKRPVARKPVRRALLVGINQYNAQQPPEKKAGGRVESLSTNQGAGQDAIPYCPERGSFLNLDGPINDVNEMETLLKGKFGFTEVYKLIDGQATRSGILAALEKYFISDAVEGDVCVFYYSGHGSRVRDSGNGEQKGYDETIVPADSNRGARDIRDKELRDLLARAIKEKHVVLTLIFDSCNSGSVVRGAEKIRSAAYCENDVAKEPGFRPPSSRPEDVPENIGALVLTAAQDIQPAGEKSYGNLQRGNFSWALTEVLRQPVVGESEAAESIFRRVVSKMESSCTQLPVMAGTAERRRAPLFGGAPVGGWSMPTANVIRKSGKQVWLEGGLAVGLGERSVLRRLEPGGKKGNALITVTRLFGLNGCEAVVTDGDEKAIQTGDPFVVETWVPRQAALLKVWMPPALAQNAVQRLAGEVAALRRSAGTRLVDDPTETFATEIVQYDAAGWKGWREQGQVESFGPLLNVKGLVAGAMAAAPIFINLPPSPELRQAIKIGKGTPRPAIEVTDQIEEADYILAGRARGAQVEYAWVRRAALKKDNTHLSRGGADKSGGALSGGARESMPALMPQKEDKGWVAVDWTKESLAQAAEKLEECAVTLSRVKGWLEIQAKPLQGFPYRLALREKDTTPIIEGDRDGSKEPERVYEGKHYELLLVADEQQLKQMKEANKLTQQFVYVFGIGSSGCSFLLYPDPNSGGVENKLPLDPSKADALIPLPSDVVMEDPFGLDTYIMLVTSQPLKSPDVLSFCAQDYKDRGTRGAGDETPLGQLLLSMGGATRDPRLPTPTDWSLDRMHLRSAPRSQ